MTLEFQTSSPEPYVAQFATAAVVGLLLTGCGGEAPPATQAPPAEVRIVTAASEPSANLVEVSGRVEAVRTAE